MSKNSTPLDNETIKKRFNRTAYFYDCMDKMISDKWREKALSKAMGKVLEVGIGTGKNISQYPQNVTLTGIDFSSGMLKKAREKVKANNYPISVELIEMDAQYMSFPDNSFDTVVATCVFCSVPDPIKALKEVKRVCKPDGQIILLEHMRSNNPVLGIIMDIINPIALNLIGSNINRKTIDNIQHADIQVKKTENVMGEIFKLIIASP